MELFAFQRSAAPQLAIRSRRFARRTKQDFDAAGANRPDGCVEIVFNLGDRFINADTGDVSRAICSPAR